MLKIVGAGFGRTGTASLKAALEEIGFGPCYHMFEMDKNPGHPELWLKAQRGESIDWHALFADYQSTADWPACAFWDQHLEAFPDAQVLLTVRDPNAWYDSVFNTIYHARSDNPLLADSEKLTPEERAQREKTRADFAMIDQVIWQGTFHGRFADRAFAIAVFDEQIANVRRRVPADRLLVFDVKQGWEPLSAFLGVPVPDHPFPHVNDSAAMRERLGQGGLL